MHISNVGSFLVSEHPGFIDKGSEVITALEGEVTLVHIGMSVRYTAEAMPLFIILHAELDPTLLVNGSVTFTWFKDRTAVTELSFYRIVYRIASYYHYSRLFIQVGGAYPITGDYSCLIENDYYTTEPKVGMEIRQSTVCES